MSKRILVIAGATASGKSAHALSVAGSENGVIINADSQQLYKDLPILTARPSAEEETIVPHRLYGVLAADEHASTGKWLRFARMEIDWAQGEGLTPVIVGGTGLYLKALMEGIAEVPEIDENVHRQSITDYEEMGKEAFSDRLRAVDPEFFTRLKVYDRQRLTRAYEVWLGTGKSLTYWQGRGNKPPYPDAIFEVTKIELPREELYKRCDARFIKMVAQGAVEEVRAAWPLLQQGLPIKKIIGVQELMRFVTKELTLDQAVNEAQQATRNYAKRQLTWLRNQL